MALKAAPCIGAINDYNVIIDFIEGTTVPSITIRNLDQALKSRLRLQAARHGRSMEEEARDILRNALSRQRARPSNLAAAIRARFAPLGGVELPLPRREPIRPAPELGS